MCVHITLEISEQVFEHESGLTLGDGAGRPSGMRLPLGRAAAYTWPVWPLLGLTGGAADRAAAGGGEGDGGEGGRRRFGPETGVAWMRWGLIPGWAGGRDKAERLRRGTVNARLETAAEKPAFREAWRQRRALVPVNSFFEYQHRAGEGGAGGQGLEKVPYRLWMPDRRLFYLAALWEPPVFTAEPTFTIGTVEARGEPRRVHNSQQRMPLILDESSGLAWLRGEWPGEALGGNGPWSRIQAREEGDF